MAEEKKQAIERVSGTTTAAAVTVGDRGVMLRSLEELLRFAQMCVSNGAAPKGMSDAQAALAIQAGLERGMGALGGLQAAVIINGVLSWRGWAATAFIQNSAVIVRGSWRTWVEGQGDDRAGYCRAQRVGYAEPFQRSFSVRDAKVASLWGNAGPWKTRPDNMLEWRAIGDMGRFHFGDVLGGVPIAEDVEGGGIGAVDVPREMPALPGPQPPRVAVRDPILEELAVLDRVVASAVEKTPAVQAIINSQVEEIFGAPVATSEDLPRDTVLFVNKDGSEAGRIVGLSAPCQRCGATLNVMGGCDTCGWPGEDMRDGSGE